ncbi:MAG: (2Fe-2S) ferredoxin domain-containing protein [Candidatus Poseidoniales archaeon]|mgnify:FL=1|nr:(2Fe-2S) ferredoxin domain-containing protein [Candidatus Poseidoniales archaeon]RUA03470.1 MAG: (2Fe-2S) ferredoxin domain-containing protein [Candidatus Poseidoniales archaeon]
MPEDPKGRPAPGYRLHLFICGNERNPDHPRGCCADKGSLEVMRTLKRAAKAAGISDVRVQKSGCLDFCENGISCVVYPEGTWYTISNPDEDLPLILEHLRTGEVAEACLMRFE